MTHPDLQFDQELARIRASIHAAARRAERDPAEVGLVAVTKGVSVQRVRLAHAAGIRCVGENRIQEATAKMAELEDLNLEWHFIGHLQTNKVADAIGRFDVIHSVDSARLLEAIGRRASQTGVRQRILLQVNVAEDPRKFGFKAHEVAHAVEQAEGTEGIALEGFMTIAPRSDHPEDARSAFSGLRKLRDQVAPGLRTLSMGMTHDLEVAVEEGATLVRVGTGLFGSREPQEDC